MAKAKPWRLEFEARVHVHGFRMPVVWGTTEIRAVTIYIGYQLNCNT